MFTIFGMVTFGLVTKFSRYVSLGSITGIIGFFIEFGNMGGLLDGFHLTIMNS